MTPKNPTILPGKRLQPPHLHLPAANLCGEAYTQREITPLLLHGEKRFWIPKGSSEKFLGAVLKKNPAPLWEKAKTWQNRFHLEAAEESPAIAGWLLLKNLAQCQSIREKQKPPFDHLRKPQSPLQILTTLNHFLFYDAGGPDPTKEMARRDLLAILVIKNLSDKQIQEEVLSCFSGKGYTQEDYPSWFKISYGFPDQTQKWNKTPLGYINTTTQRLLSREPEKVKQWLRKISLL